MGLPYGELPEGAPRDRFAPRPLDLPAPVPLDPGADLAVLDDAKVLAAPDDPADRPAWRAALHRWREGARARHRYDGARYDDPDTAWAARAWSTALVWLWDEALHDWEHHRFDADRLLAAYAPFGGLDAVVLWHAYPVIGLDDRNQVDWYRQVPGLAALVRDLHARGVRVFLDHNPWDVGTRRTGRSDAEELAALLADTGADGLFLDTMKEADAELLAHLAALRPRPVLEGESRVPTSGIAQHQASWAQWMADSPVPGVLRARWFEQRHMLHATRRWDRDRAPQLASAWVNGAGVLVWDVVFGAPVPWHARDLATARAARRVHLALGDHLVHGAWEPLTDLHPSATADGVAGSRWEHAGTSLLTLVARRAHTGPLLPAPAAGRVLDVLNGDELGPDAALSAEAGALVGVLVVPEGGAVPGLEALLAAARADVRPADAPAARVPRPPVRAAVAPARGTPTPGAVVIRGGTVTLAHTYRERETGLYEEAPYVGDWKPLPPRLHAVRTAERTVRLGHGGDVAVDADPVTNAEVAAWLRASGYAPPVPDRFLAHWVDGAPVPGTEGQAVTHVDLDDARAHAAWRGARLPTEDEWQVAAADPGWRGGGTSPVREWTESEHRDGRTRWVVLKGATAAAVEGSPWYLDGGPLPPEWSIRLLLTGGGTARSAAVGFRCAVDLPPAAGPGGEP
jgi:hypothetical protein